MSATALAASLLLFTSFIGSSLCQTPMAMLIVIEEPDTPLLSILNDAAPQTEKKFGDDIITVHISTVTVDRANVLASFEKVCAALFKGISIILDLTWTGWEKLRNVADENGIIYKRGDCQINSYVQAIDDLLMLKNATDVGLIFEDERELNQSLYYLIGNSIIRLVVIDEFTDKTVSKIRSMRPSPSYYAIYASTPRMEELFRTAVQGGLVKRNGIWYLVFTDNNYKDFKYLNGDSQLNVSVTVLSLRTEVCCRLIGEPSCNCPPDVQIFPQYFRRLLGLLVNLMSELQKSGISVEPKPTRCNSPNATQTVSNATSEAFNKNLIAKLGGNDTFDYLSDKGLITYKAEIEMEILQNGVLEPLATWTRRTKIKEADGKKIEPAKRFFRIGTAPSVPWTMPKVDPATGHVMKDENGKEMWDGYCIDFIKKLSEEMQFDYDIVVPEDREFGKKMANGQWNGLIGDLSKGETDIVVAALTMTSEREEVIDFVAPYFEQSGILIVIRKPVRKPSLFKFMTVLKVEVWLSIVGALTLTGIMIWILDKYSPYSAKNNKRLYPYPCRDFTLKESFWFALTSFTPQGGGEAPKALSSRTLVAAYWLFVVLMLATFTANLAAFLTVERMQTPVQSLEQLARQSRINYTVLANHSVHRYFMNMKNAEDKLYTVWKEITLNSTSDQVEYRVWDYPIKEQYGHILQAITQVGPVKSAEEGFRKVIESENSEFAFIHDSSAIKYEVTRNCNLTEVGEVFAEQPYAIAVQQGSHLQEEISRRILDLQKDRYFETLTSKYWNQSLKAQCLDSDDNEGITLESLGGVFIATLFGLALAMITLAGEVLYYRKRSDSQKNKRKDKKKPKGIENEKVMLQKMASKLQMKPAPTNALFEKTTTNLPRVSHISVYPRNFTFKE
ncbi:ionotropic receptor 25a [Hylaeus volcanicus]|uniref:ionotropic receptor 25a n=1 Tax=Hylaeus volcanicus TaxID=313075 RepID=UPI0023B7FA08|nr:ionotropic receptor 25a [Hylaeus volcanicus]